MGSDRIQYIYTGHKLYLKYRSVNPLNYTILDLLFYNNQNKITSISQNETLQRFRLHYT